MSEFWESSFKEKQAMWGFEPADSAIETLALFKEKDFEKILIPGFGYGRNAKIFVDKGFSVTGIEISETAINIAKENFGLDVKVYHGSVSNMPFDDEIYDGIFCYALIHLLDEKERLKLIDDCYNQLKPGGTMVFVAVSTHTSSYGEGEKLTDGQFLTKHGVKLFYYDSESVEREFGNYGLVEATEISELSKNLGSESAMDFWQIICEKEI